MVEGARPVVLVVEDEPDHRMMLEILLDSYGYEVITAGSCAEGRAQLFSSQTIDVLLTDFSLGDGTALDLVHGIGDRRPRVAIVMSGHDGPEHVERSIRTGFDAHLVKPTSLDNLRDLIADGLKKQRVSGVRSLGKDETPSERNIKRKPA